jgi:hypothetical protein
MRFPKISGLSLLASVAILAGCAGGGNMATPSTSGNGLESSHMQSQALGGARPTLKTISTNPFKGGGCTSQYTGGCVAITPSSPFQAEWCVSDSGNCTSGLVGDVTWTVLVVNAKGKTLKKLGKKINAVWSPDPGNPSVITVSTETTKVSSKVKYGVELSGCYTSGCFTDFVEYGISV